MGATIGGFLSGLIGDFLPGKPSGYIAMGAYVLGCLIALLAIELQQLASTLVAAALWGFGLYYLEGWMYIACS